MNYNNDMLIYDSLQREKKIFTPINSKIVSIYSCGLTPNKTPHIGHAIAAIRSNIIRSYLEFKGFNVKYCQNITDVDDKIIDEAKSKGIQPNEVVESNLRIYENALNQLGVENADFNPRVSQYIKDIIQYIEVLISKGYGYLTENGDVYFNVSSYKDYGKLNNVNIEELLKNVRITNKENKNSSVDFALWKSDDFEGASWDSPWGKGRPGWHIECSVMANSVFGSSIDIHCGGRDLKFPHHENEIAQCQCHNEGKKFSNYWCHFGLMRMNGEKMSKSLGNIVSIKDAINQVSPQLLIYSILKIHYRSDLNWSIKLFAENINTVLNFYRFFDQIESLALKAKSSMKKYDSEEKIEAEFIAEMDYDFSTHKALVILNDYLKKGSEMIESKDKNIILEGIALGRKIKELGNILGLFKGEGTLVQIEEGIFGYVNSLTNINTTFRNFKELLSSRILLRQHRDYKKLDEMRDDFATKGILISDSSPTKSVSWSVKLSY